MPGLHIITGKRMKKPRNSPAVLIFTENTDMIQQNCFSIRNWRPNYGASKLMAKKIGFRTHMDLIPLDASLVRGSHGVIPADSLDWPVLIAPDGAAEDEIEAVDIFEVIQKAWFTRKL